MDSDGPDPDTDPNKPNKYNIKQNIAQPSAGMWTWLWDQANSLKSGLPNEFYGCTRQSIAGEGGCSLRQGRQERKAVVGGPAGVQGGRPPARPVLASVAGQGHLFLAKKIVNLLEKVRNLGPFRLLSRQCRSLPWQSSHWKHLLRMRTGCRACTMDGGNDKLVRRREPTHMRISG